MGETLEKSGLIRKLKLLEIGTMVIASVGLLTDQLPLMMGALFLTGLQSALFGPVKYSILPQHLGNSELVGGNAWIEMGTFMAILLGTLGAGVLMASDDYARSVSLALLVIAAAGYGSSRLIPTAPPLGMPTGKMPSFNLYQETKSTLKLAFDQRISVSRSLIGNSWFWFVGAIYLTQIPALAKNVLHGDETVVSLILVMFSIGIGLGSLLCERLSGGKIEIGLVPLGSIGLTLFGFLLYLNLNAFAPGTGTLDWSHVLQDTHGLAILINVFFLGVSGGLYIVPLYALLQSRSRPAERSRVIAAANIMNSLFMVIAALFSILMLSVFQLSIAELLVSTAVLNIVVNIYLFRIVPEFIMRFIVWIVTHTAYRVQHKGLDNIPDEGAAVMVCNHISFVDALIISGSIRRPVRFVMYYKIFQWPVLSCVFRVAGAIPIAGRSEDPELYAKAFERISQALKEGELVCIFPEGKLTADGEIDVFKQGVRMILDRDPVPVIPAALQGLWNSFFSRSPNKGLLRRRWSRVTLNIGQALPSDCDTATMQLEVSKLRDGKP
jgi:1-acyl-sn-glycerol-3-phosphate acyltransferase